MLSTRLRRAVTIGVLAAAISAAFVAAPANAAETDTLGLESSATLIAKGAAVQLTVVMTCGIGDDYQLSVAVTQRVSGGKLAFGSGGAPGGTCTGVEQTFNLFVSPTVDRDAVSPPFKNGIASASANLLIIPPDFNYRFVDVTKEISIKK